MQFTVDIPDTVSHGLDSENVSRQVLELLVADQYRHGRIGAGDVRRLLGFASREETYDFLKTQKALLPYSTEDLSQDLEAIAEVLAKQ